MVEITDKESAEAWFETQPQVVCVAMAARTALRGASGLGIAGSLTHSRIALPILRALIVAISAAEQPSDKIKKSARSSTMEAEADRANDSARAAAYSASSAAYVAADYSDSSEHHVKAITCSANSAAYSSPSSAATAARSFVYSALNADVSAIETKQDAAANIHDLLEAPLWRDVTEPEGLARGRDSLIAFFEADSKVWRFWKRWYLAMIDGTWRDWDLARDVALIPDEVWEDGAAAVAKAIKEIEDARKPLSSQAARTQAKYLLQDPKRSALCSAGLSQMLERAILDIGNCLPEPFEAAEPLQKYLHQISGMLLADHLSDQEARLGQLLELAAETVAVLVRDLREAESAIGRLDAKLAAATTAVEKAELLAKAEENPKTSWRSKVGDGFATGVGEQAASALFSGPVWMTLGAGLFYILGPEANEVVAATSHCFNNVIDPEFLGRSIKGGIVDV